MKGNITCFSFEIKAYLVSVIAVMYPSSHYYIDTAPNLQMQSAIIPKSFGIKVAFTA